MADVDSKKADGSGDGAQSDGPVELAPLSLLQVTIAADRHRRAARAQSSFGVLVAIAGTVLIIAAPRVDASVNDREVSPRSPGTERAREGEQIARDIRIGTAGFMAPPRDRGPTPPGTAPQGGSASSSPQVTISSPLVTFGSLSTSRADRGSDRQSGPTQTVDVGGPSVSIESASAAPVSAAAPLTSREILSQELVRKRPQTTSPPRPAEHDASDTADADRESGGAAPTVSAWQLAREQWDLDGEEERSSRRVSDPVPLRITLLVIALTLAAWFIGAARRQSQIAEHYENCALALRLGGKDTRMVQRSRRLIALPRESEPPGGLLSTILRALTGR